MTIRRVKEDESQHNRRTGERKGGLKSSRSRKRKNDGHVAKPQDLPSATPRAVESTANKMHNLETAERRVARRTFSGPRTTKLRHEKRPKETSVFAPRSSPPPRKQQIPERASIAKGKSRGEEPNRRTLLVLEASEGLRTNFHAHRVQIGV